MLIKGDEPFVGNAAGKDEPVAQDLRGGHREIVPHALVAERPDDKKLDAAGDVAGQQGHGVHQAVEIFPALAAEHGHDVGAVKSERLERLARRRRIRGRWPEPVVYACADGRNASRIDAEQLDGIAPRAVGNGQ